MAKLYAELTSDKGGRVVSRGGNNIVNVSFRIGNVHIGDIELQWLDEDEKNEHDREYLLKYYHCDDCDPFIIKQGHTDD